MKRSSLIVGASCCLMCVSGAFAQTTTDKKVTPATPAKQPAAKPTGMPSPEDMMKAMEAAGKKNENHDRFKAFEGRWDATVKCWMDPSSEPEVSTGTMINTLINDGRFCHHEFKGEFQGQPFTGNGVCGYNNTTKKYESTWMDSMSTAIMFSTGTYDDKTKTFTMTGDCVCPISGPCKMRETLQIIDNSKHVQTMYMTPVGQPEAKGMEITYVRSKGGATNATPMTKDPIKPGTR